MLRILLSTALLAAVVFASILAQDQRSLLIPVGEPVDFLVSHLAEGADGYLLMHGGDFNRRVAKFTISDESVEEVDFSFSGQVYQVGFGDSYTLVQDVNFLRVIDGNTSEVTFFSPETDVQLSSLNSVVYFGNKFYAIDFDSFNSEFSSFDPVTSERELIATLGRVAGPLVSSKTVIHNGRMFFIAITEDENAMGLWASDGTPEGTTLIAPVMDESAQVTVLNDQVVVSSENELFTLSADDELTLLYQTAPGENTVKTHFATRIGEGANPDWLICNYFGTCSRLSGSDLSLTDQFFVGGVLEMHTADNGDVVLVTPTQLTTRLQVVDGQTTEASIIYEGSIHNYFTGLLGLETRAIAHHDSVTFFTVRSSQSNDRNLNLYLHQFGTFAEITPPTENSGFSSTPLVKDGVVYVAYQEGNISQLYRLNLKLRPSLIGNVFNDRNGNGVRDDNDLGIPNLRITATGSSTSFAFTDTSGNYALYLTNNTPYEITAEDLNCRPLLTTPAESEVTYTGTLITNYDFSYGNATENNPSLATTVTSAPPRCGFEVPFWIDVLNNGCTSHSIQVQLTLPDNVELISANPQSNETGSLLTWDYEEQLIPGNGHQIQLFLRMPGEDFVNTPIELTSVVVAPDMTAVSDTFYYNQPLFCAIDPNDKQVRPARQEPSNSNYTRFDETLTYTIRFQNTGNDTAFTVRIEDQLSNDLDWETFRPLGSSHSFQATVSESGLAQFLFENILLPDSIVNEPASHGYVNFSIDFIEAIAEGTAVENTVGIYFDFNRPVITNTVLNTAVEFLDQDQDGFFFWDECDDENENINPDALDLTMNGIDENCDGEDGVSSVINHLPGEVTIFPNPTAGQLTLDYSLPSPLQAELFDLRGQRLLKVRLVERTQINLADLSTGSYLLRLTDVKTGSFTVTKVFLY